MLIIKLLSLALGITIGSSLVYLNHHTLMPVTEYYKLLARIILATWSAVVSYEIYKMLK